MKRRFELYTTPKPPEIFGKPSGRMIKTLRSCLQFEALYPGKPYGPADVGGSFLSLYKRGFLDITTGSEKDLHSGSWFVTIEGLHFLLDLSHKTSMPDESILLSNIYKLKENVMLLHSSMYNLKLTAGQIVIK